MTHVGMECLVLAVRPEGVFRVPDGEASRRAGSGKSDTANRESHARRSASYWLCDARIKQAPDERQRFLFDVLAETLGRMAADERKTAKREPADRLTDAAGNGRDAADTR